MFTLCISMYKFLHKHVHSNYSYAYLEFPDFFVSRCSRCVLIMDSFVSLCFTRETMNHLV